MPTPEQERVMKAVQERYGSKNFTLDPFTFTMNFLPATLSIITNAQFLVQNDSAFAICKTSIVVTDTSDAFVTNLSDTPKVMPFLITLSDSGSGRDLMDTGVHVDNLFGTAQRPYVWTKIKLLDPSSTFTGRLQNLSATSRNVRMAFHGFKVFGDVNQFKAHAR